MPQEPGRVLFWATIVRDRDESNWWVGLGILAVSSYAFNGYSHHRGPTAILLAVILGSAPFFLRFMSAKIAFFENGIDLPKHSSGAPPRFVSWQEIERFHWDGDLLTLVPVSSLMNGFGLLSDMRLSITWTFRVPPGMRAEIDGRLPAAR
jgi:hypothetical protein